MMRKTIAALAMAGALATGGVATANSASAATFEPGRVYTSSAACAAAGNAGFPTGQWVGWYCQPLRNAQWQLWVQRTY